MTRPLTTRATAPFLVALLLPLAACEADPGSHERLTAAMPPAGAASPSDGLHAGLLYGRVTMADGETWEGRLRFGAHEEALWSNTFNGAKDEVDRPFMARFGEIARLDARGRDLRVTLRSGRVVELDRFGADDFADGVRVWDRRRGVVDLGEWGIRTIEFLPTPPEPSAGDASAPLYGTVRTRQGTFTGLIQWDREECLAGDALYGHSAGGDVEIPFEAIRSIARHSRDASVVTLVDGREVLLSGTREVGEGNAGVYVDDPRYGRVLVSRAAFERVDFRPGATAPGYDDFAPGRPLTGTVLTRSGRRLAGRLVYDLDERETTETLDAPARDVDYLIPFRLIASIAVPGPDAPGSQPAAVTLRSGEVLELERAGDLGPWNAGLLVFVDGRARPEHVPWRDVARVELN